MCLWNVKDAHVGWLNKGEDYFGTGIPQSNYIDWWLNDNE